MCVTLSTIPSRCTRKTFRALDDARLKSSELTTEYNTKREILTASVRIIWRCCLYLCEVPCGNWLHHTVIAKVAILLKRHQERDAWTVIFMDETWTTLLASYNAWYEWKVILKSQWKVRLQVMRSSRLTHLCRFTHQDYCHGHRYGCQYAVIDGVLSRFLGTGRSNWNQSEFLKINAGCVGGRSDIYQLLRADLWMVVFVTARVEYVYQRHYLASWEGKFLAALNK